MGFRWEPDLADQLPYGLRAAGQAWRPAFYHRAQTILSADHLLSLSAADIRAASLNPKAAYSATSSRCAATIDRIWQRLPDLDRPPRLIYPIITPMKNFDQNGPA